jgi:ribosomal protein S18 acetylase RimI-like enzyme
MSSSLIVSTRRATPQDVGVLVELMREFHAESNYILGQEQATAAFLTLLNRPDLGGVWLATLDNTVAGYVVLTLRYSMDHAGFSGHVEDLFVRSTARRQRVARSLLTELFEECKRQRCGTVHVEVDGQNVPATSLYRGFGLDEHRDGRVFLHGKIAAPVA